MEELTQDEWAEQLENDDKAVIIDVRTDNELATGIIPNAVHIDFYRGHDFIAEIQKLDKNKNYYYWDDIILKNKRKNSIPPLTNHLSNYNTSKQS